MNKFLIPAIVVGLAWLAYNGCAHSAQDESSGAAPTAARRQPPTPPPPPPADAQ